MPTKYFFSIFNSAAEVAVDRFTKDSFISSYIVGFALFNWKAWIYLLDLSISSDQKIDSMVGVFKSGCYLGIIAPVVTSLYFVFLHPRIAQAIDVQHTRLIKNREHAISNTEFDGDLHDKLIKDMEENHSKEIKRIYEVKKGELEEKEKKITELMEKVKNLQHSTTKWNKVFSLVVRSLDEYFKNDLSSTPDYAKEWRKAFNELKSSVYPSGMPGYNISNSISDIRAAAKILKTNQV